MNIIVEDGINKILAIKTNNSTRETFLKDDTEDFEVSRSSMIKFKIGAFLMALTFFNFVFIFGLPYFFEQEYIIAHRITISVMLISGLFIFVIAACLMLCPTQEMLDKKQYDFLAEKYTIFERNKTTNQEVLRNISLELKDIKELKKAYQFIMLGLNNEEINLILREAYNATGEQHGNALFYYDLFKNYERYILKVKREIKENNCLGKIGEKLFEKKISKKGKLLNLIWN